MILLPNIKQGQKYKDWLFEIDSGVVYCLNQSKLRTLNLPAASRSAQGRGITQTHTSLNTSEYPEDRQRESGILQVPGISPEQLTGLNSAVRSKKKSTQLPAEVAQGFWGAQATTGDLL